MKHELQMTGMEFWAMKASALKAGALGAISLYAGIGVFLGSNLLLGFIEGFENIPFEKSIGMSLLFAILAFVFNRWKYSIEKRKIAIEESKDQREKEKHLAFIKEQKEKHDAAMSIIAKMQDGSITFDAEFVKTYLDKD